MISNALFSSKSVMWETPQALFNEYNEEFDFQTDVCALPENAKCKHYYTPAMDGLKQDWKGTCWMNPPYGRQVGKWIQKAYESSQKGATVVCLLPVRTGTRWFHKHICNRAEIRFIKGRLKFGGSTNSAPFDSMIVIFYPNSQSITSW